MVQIKIPERYNIKKFKQAIRQPDKFATELRRLFINMIYNGENFMDKDWDNMIILDACRPDFLEKHSSFGGSYSRKMSLGAASREFFNKTFSNNKYYDTVYVTGNVYVECADDSLYRVIKTYANNSDSRKGWLPEPTFDAATEAYEEHPNKRIVVHFMQPHAPYLGKYAENLRERVSEENSIGFRVIGRVSGNNYKYDKEIQDLPRAFKQGYIQRKELDKAYTENLKLVLDYVEKLLKHLDGKTVITSDHSESLGDFRGTYTHKSWAFSGKLREVPWIVIEGERRDTFSEPPVESVSIGEDIVRENLRDLGYL